MAVLERYSKWILWQAIRPVVRLRLYAHMDSSKTAIGGGGMRNMNFIATEYAHLTTTLSHI